MADLKTATAPNAKIVLEAHLIEGGTTYFVTSTSGDEFGQKKDKHGATELFNEVVAYIRANPAKGDYYANGKR